MTEVETTIAPLEHDAATDVEAQVDPLAGGHPSEKKPILGIRSSVV